MKLIIDIFSAQWIYLLSAAYLFAIGFLVDQQFNNCVVSERSKWYQRISTTWHILIELVTWGLCFFHLKAKPDAPIWLPVLVFLWILSTLPMGIMQHKRDKNRQWYGMGDGKGNLVEIIMQSITCIVNLPLKNKLSMAIVSVAIRLLVLVSSVIYSIKIV